MPNPVINRRLVGASASAGAEVLLVGLMSYWSLENTAYPDLVGPNNLTAPNGGVTVGGGGIIGNRAGLSASPAGSVLSHVDTASLAAGAGVSFTVSAWTTYFAGHPDSLLIGKWDGTNNDYAILLQGSNNYWIFAVTNLAGSVVEVDTGILAAQLGNVGQTKWYYLVAGYDDALKAIWIQINGGLRLWRSCVGVQRSAADFCIGNKGSSGSSPLNAGVDECSFWHRSLSPDEVSLLYNGGLANQYPFTGTVVPGSAPTLGQDWARRVIVNGGAAPSQNSINAIDAFEHGLLVDGIAGLLSANCFAPDSLIAALTPIYTTFGIDPWTNTGFVSGDLTINGLTGNASTKFLDSGFNPIVSLAISISNFYLGLGGQSAYVYNTPDNVNGFDMGNQDSLNILGIQAEAAGGLTVTINGNGAGGTVVASPGPGFYSDERTAATVRKTYFASSGSAWAQLGATDTGTFTSYANLSCWAFGLNQSGSLNVPSNDTISFVGWHVGFTSAQGQALYNRVQALRVAFGGGFR